MSYQHRQTGTLVLVTMGIAGVMILLVFGAATELPIAGATIPITLVALLMLNFGSLNVRLDGNNLEVAFGIGWIKRSIPLKRIESVQVTKTRWFYGWGIRLTPRGWLWNTSGFDAVELTYHNGKHFLIGTDDPDGLAAAIDQALAR